MKIEEKFQKIAERTANITGSVWAFIMAVVIIALYSLGEPWPDRVNVLTNAIMFFMLFLAQSGQNRQGRAIQLKLDEIIISLDETDDKVAGIEKESDEVLTKVEKQIESQKEK